MLEKINSIFAVIFLILSSLISVFFICKYSISYIKENNTIEKGKAIIMCICLFALLVSITLISVILYKRRTVSSVTGELVRTRTEIQLTEQSVSAASSTIRECRDEIRAGRGAIEECRGTLSELGESISEGRRIIEKIGRSKTE